MNKFILVMFLLIVPSVYADESTEALYWKYGSCFSMRQANPVDQTENPKMNIWSWNCPSNQPDEAQINLDVIDYKKHISDKKAENKIKKDASLAKLKISEEEFKDLVKGVLDDIS